LGEGEKEGWSLGGAVKGKEKREGITERGKRIFSRV